MFVLESKDFVSCMKWGGIQMDFCFLFEEVHTYSHWCNEANACIYLKVPIVFFFFPQCAVCILTSEEPPMCISAPTLLHNRDIVLKVAWSSVFVMSDRSGRGNKKFYTLCTHSVRDATILAPYCT